jgi:hypothetical protein
VKLTSLDRTAPPPPVKDDKLLEKFPASLDTVDFFAVGKEVAGERDREEIETDVEMGVEGGRGVEAEEEVERLMVLLLPILLLSVLALPLVSSYVPLSLLPFSRISRDFSRSYDGSLRYKNGLQILESVFMSKPFSLFSGARQALKRFITFESNGL